MEILKTLRNMVSGKKAYLVGTLMIVLGLLNQDNQLVLEGLGVITLRAGLSKI